MYLGRFFHKVGDSFPLFRKVLSFIRLVSEGHPPLKNIVGSFCFQNSMYLIFAPRQMERQMERQKHQVGLCFVYFHNIFLCKERSHLWRDISHIVSFGYLLFESLRLSFHTHQWYNLSYVRKYQIGCFQSFLELAPGNKGKRQRVTLSFSLLPLGL